MSMATVERKILSELKNITDNPKLKIKDVMEWSTGEIKAQEGEKLYFLSKLQVYCVVKENK